ncbi:hypothetical protein GPECTOR_72g593 [Gonium pectorale]|uniref:Uncharacterized protein n=1 Tax=Gonium pectorale TaxID=33097 RepID=A0A150G2P7_GONPE|nr:hypothetical protein GPECTOR_72g593 [Gonium pectorale]|eukprot:KXZ44146.1 hypothetical protein GPECTOR_72g593 [Gonium pectorale]
MATAYGLKNPGISNTTVIWNVDRDGKPLVVQGAHVDLDSDQLGFTMIIVLQGSTIVVYPGSKPIMREMWRLKELHAKGNIDHATFVRWIQSYRMIGQRLLLKLCNVLFFTDHTVHRGDRGITNYRARRLHWCILDGGKKNKEMHLCEQGPYGPLFNKVFTDTSSVYSPEDLELPSVPKEMKPGRGEAPRAP